MKKQRKCNKKKVTALIFTLSLCFMVPFANKNNNTENKNKILKISGLTSPITIDDSTPGNDWAWASGESWFGGGTGVQGDPYIIEDLVIDGLGIYSGITILNSIAYFTIENCTIYHVGGTHDSGIYLEHVANGTITMSNFSNIIHGIYSESSSHNNFIGNIIHGNNIGTGINLQSSHNNTIINNDVKNKHQGIRLASSSDNIITGNTVEKSTNYGFLLFVSSNDNTVSNNIAKNSTSYDGIHIRDSNNNLISENTVCYNYEEGIDIDGSESNLISDNSVFNNGEIGITLWTIYASGYSNKNNITGNTVYEHPKEGIFLIDCDDNLISGNTIHHNNKTGIRLDACLDNIISDNIIFDNLMHGINLSTSIALAYSDYNNISKNLIYHNNESGINIEANCWYNDVWENRIYDNTIHGIFLKNADYGENYRNWIYDNGEIGVYCNPSSTNNQFYENVFVRNKKHAMDTGSNNDWNSTSIGNYWDNHTGPDTSPHDGIVDIQYNISGSANSIDYLPIAEDGAPRITILSPNAGDAFNETAPDFLLMITDDYLVSKWYKVNSSSTIFPLTELSGTIDQTAWDTLSDGNLTLTFYAKDLPGYTRHKEVVVQKDTLAPVITVNSPVSGEEFGNTPPSFNITVIDPNLDTIWYTLNNTITILSGVLIWNISQVLWDALPEGTVTITIHANDTLGHSSSQAISISKNIPSSRRIGLDYFKTGFLIALFSGVAIITVIIKMYHKKKIIIK